jgi:hypothetical protein
MTISAMLVTLAVIAVSLEISVTAAVLGAVALYVMGHGEADPVRPWNFYGSPLVTGPLFVDPRPPGFHSRGLKGAPAAEVTAAACFSY